MSRQIERDLHREVMVRLRHAPVTALVLPIPNGVYLPCRSEAERTLARRIVHRMKGDGEMTPGAADLVVLWDGGSGCIELKRAATKGLFGPVMAGRLSDEQKAFRARCEAAGVPYVVCSSWAEVRDTLIAWRCLPASYSDPETRIGKAASPAAQREPIERSA